MKPVPHTIGDRLDPGIRRSAEVRERDDRILESLRGVHRDETNGVVTRLGDTGLLGVAAAALLAEPACERSQAAASSGGEGTGLVDEFGQIRGRLLTIPPGKRHLDHP